MSRKNFNRIENFVIYVMNTKSLDDPKLLASSQHCEVALQSVFATIYRYGSKSIKTLRVRYTSCFEGDVDLRRPILEYPRPGQLEEAMLKDCNTGITLSVDRDGLDKLFGHTRILNSLKVLAGRVEDPIIHGDIRIGYINELTTAISGGKVRSARTIQRERQYNDAQKARMDVADGAKRNLMSTRGFMEEMIAKHPDNDFYASPLSSHDELLTFPADAIAGLSRPPSEVELREMGCL